MSEGIVELEDGVKEDSSAEENGESEAESKEPAEDKRLPKTKTRKQKRDKKKALYEKMKQNSKLKYKLKENDIFRLRYQNKWRQNQSILGFLAIILFSWNSLTIKVFIKKTL